LTFRAFSAKLSSEFNRFFLMETPCYYLVANEQAFALDDDGVTMFGAPVNPDGTVDWEYAYDLNPCEEDLEYVAHMNKLLIDSAKLYYEHNVEVFTK